MKTIELISIIFLIYCKQCLSVFDIDELKSFNYGIDIRKEPVLLNEDHTEEETNKVVLSSKYGQSYQCDFPDTIEQEKQKEEAEKEAIETGIPDLLKPMEHAPCLRKTKDWWSYEFCYGKEIKQYHMSEDNQIQGEIISLGIFESEYDWGDAEEKTEQRESRLRRYHTQQYVNGSKCDLTGNGRRTEVRFQCEEGSADYIARLDEPESCSYVLTVHTMKICHHPFLKPPTPTQTVTITCNPVLTNSQYQEYLEIIRIEKENRRLKEEREIEQKKRLQEERDKYLKEKQLHNDEEGGVEVEEEGEEMEGSELDEKNGRSNLYRAAKVASEALKGTDIKQSVINVVNNPADLKDYLDEAFAEFKNVKTPNPVPETDVHRKPADREEHGKGEEEEEEVDEEEREEENLSTEEKIKTKATDKGEPVKIVAPEPVTDLPPQFEELGQQLDDDEGLDPDSDEVDLEIKTLKERYKDRRDKLKAIKAHVKESMEKQYASIVKEAEEELGMEEGRDPEENSEAMKELSKTLDKLLGKLDQTEKDIAAVDKELEQFAEYDSDENQVKSIPPVKEGQEAGTPSPSEASGPSKSPTDDRVKVRVSRIQRGNQAGTNEELRTKQTTELEKSVQRELEKAGIGDGDKIQVKIITTGYYDGDDETLHVLSEEESETFRNMIVNLIGSTSEADREQAHHSQLEDSYSFVWESPKSGSLSDLDLPSEVNSLEGTESEQTDTQTGRQTDTLSSGESADSIIQSTEAAKSEVMEDEDS